MSDAFSTPKALGVYKAIATIQGHLARVGISKDRRNTEQKFSFRGIDDVYNAVSPLMAEHGLCILPRVLRREQSERLSKAGSVMFNIVLEVAFDFVAASDGSSHTVVTWGESTDSGDKATNKAMSAAYKYAILQAFCVPTQGESPDADQHTPPETAPAPMDDENPMYKAALAAAQKGLDSYRVFYRGISEDARAKLATRHEELKALANGVKVENAAA